MNRRGFFRSLAATALVAAASSTRIGQTALRVIPEAGKTYAEFLAASMLETKETLVANILNLYMIPSICSVRMYHAFGSVMSTPIGAIYDEDTLQFAARSRTATVPFEERPRRQS